MAEDRKSGPPTRKDERAERLAAALRDNLRRRKAQARGRADADHDGPGGTSPTDAPDRKPLKP